MAKASIALFGANTTVGACVIAEAMSQYKDLQITALFQEDLAEIRKEYAQMEKLYKFNLAGCESAGQLKLVQVDCFNADAIAPHLANVDGVINTSEFDITGASNTKHSECSFAILNAMMKGKCREYLGLHSWYTEESSRANADPDTKYLLNEYKGALDDMRMVEKKLESDYKEIDFTIVCAPMATEDSHIDKELAVIENAWCPDGPAKEKDIPAANIADFLLSFVADAKKYQRKVICIAHP